MSCPFHQPADSEAPAAAPKFDDMPPRIAALPLDPRGYPIPFFVATLPDGTRDFRMADGVKFRSCLRDELCWVCGDYLGQYKAFVLGPMCSITRTTAEPPAHLDCARFSAKFCPFLTRPHMKRREDEFTRANEANSAGFPIKRNPGVVGVWITKRFGRFPDHQGKTLLNVGDPITVEWYREGRAATRAEVEESIRAGFPSLAGLCESSDDLAELHDRVAKASRWLPAP